MESINTWENEKQGPGFWHLPFIYLPGTLGQELSDLSLTHDLRDPFQLLYSSYGQCMKLYYLPQIGEPL